MQVDPTQYQGVAQQALGQVMQGLQTQAPTAESLYGQMQAVQAPELERQRLALENRLAAQGRLGTQTNMYGGTPEALALEKAAQEQAAQNFFTAQQLAPQLAQQNLANTQGLFNLGSQAQMTPAQMQALNLQNVGTALGTSFLPQQQQLAALTPAIQASNIGQSAALGQSEALYKAGMQGLQAEGQALGAVAGLEASRAEALGKALQGLFTASASQPVSSGERAIGELISLLGGGTDG
jgi:hypothetical protein